MPLPGVGEHWAYREKARTLGEPVRPVEVLQLGPGRSHKVRVKWLDGEYEGLDQWVPAVRLVVRWESAEAFVTDETALLALRAAQPQQATQVMIDAVRTVWFATPSRDLSFNVRDRIPIEVEVDDFDGLPTTADELLETPGAFVDADGTVHAGQDASVELARRLRQQHPGDVLTYAAAEVDRFRRSALTGWRESEFTREGGFRVDTDVAAEALRDVEACAALLAEWCGVDAANRYDELSALRSEVKRLGGVIEQTANWLKTAGHPQKAAMLLRDGRSQG